MRIVGQGIDIVKVDRVHRQIVGGRSDFLDNWFTAEEQQLARGSNSESQFFAGRIACKEAVVKALGTGFAGEVTWLDVQILANKHGSPLVSLVGGARGVADRLSVTQWFLSISHTEEFAVASAIATADV